MTPRKRVLAVMMSAIVAVPLMGQQLPPEVASAPKRVTDPKRVDYDFQPFAGSQVTVIVAFARDCQACLQSMPFYKRLSQLPVMDGKRGTLIVTAERAIAPVQAFVMSHEHGFTPHRAITYPPDNRFQITTLPSILVYERGTTVRGRWTGLLTAVQEKEVLAVIGQAAKAAKE